MATKQKTTFNRGTKNLITEAVKAKVKLTRHIEILKEKDLVYYICKDGSLRLYIVLNVKKDEVGYITATVQPINKLGEVEKNKFDTIANKLQRVWIQLGDNVEYNNPMRKQPNNYHKGYVEKIGYDTDLQQLEVYVKGTDNNHKTSTRIFVGDELNELSIVY